MSSPVIIPHYLEKDYLQNLNDRFKDYVSRVRQMREQGQRMETANFMNTTKILEDEIMDLKNMYERQLEDLRNKLDEVSRDRTQHQLSAAKNGALAAELQDKLNGESATRQKAENALADAHRLIADKENQLQDSRVTVTQHQNAHADTKRDRDNLSSALTQTQQALDSEAAARSDMQTLLNQLKDKLKFEQQLHDKELQELRNRLGEAEKALAQAEQRMREHDIIDENLSAMMAKAKLHSQVELRRFKEESEISYQNNMNQLRVQLENESANLAASTDENIRLKAQIEQLHSKNINLESKCGSLENQNASLIQGLEMERQQSSNAIKNLEAKLRDLQEALMNKVRELGLAYNAHIPLDLEIDAFATLLDAEEKRLRLSLENSPPLAPVRSRTWISSKTVTRPSTTVQLNSIPPSTTTVSAIRKPLARPKTTSGALTLSHPKAKPEPITTASPYRQTSSYIPNFVDYHSPASSCTGNVRILEVNPDGSYVRLFNTSAYKDEEIGGHMVQQNVAGRPVTVFRFPPRTRLKALSHATVWSASSLAKHNPPSDFLWKEQHKWGTGPECTTIFCKPSGQAVAWTTAAYPFGVPNHIPTRDTGPALPSGEIPASEKEEDNSPRNKSPNPTPWEIESKPHAKPPTDPLHPHSVLPRTKSGGNEGMTINPQARSQTSRPDPLPGNRNGLSSTRRVTEKSSNSPHGGTIRVVPGSEFSSHTQQYKERLDKLNSQQKIGFNPPMPRPYAAARN